MILLVATTEARGSSGWQPNSKPFAIILNVKMIESDRVSQYGTRLNTFIKG